MTRRGLNGVVSFVLVAGAFALAGCGGESTTSGSASRTGAAEVTKAKAAIAVYTGKPSAFPVDAPLEAGPAPGTKFAFLQNSTPVAGLLASLLRPAAETMGVQLDVVKGGASSSSQQAAMDSIIATRPQAVLLPAIEPAAIDTQLEQLDRMKLPVVAHGIMQHEKYGIDAAIFNTATAQLAGKLLADWVIARDGDKADVAFYPTPELSFSTYIKKSFDRELSTLCASCKVRYVTVPVATIGSTAPSLVVSDLQAHPTTTTAVFATQEASTGLPAALSSAGLKVATVGFAPNPAILQDIKTGAATAGLALDLPVMMWTQLDEAARLATGQPLTADEAKGVPPLQFLERADIGFDPSKGWSGYPDFARRFAKLWNTG